MTTIEIINTILGVGFACLGWFARELWTAVKELKDDLIQLRGEVLLSYVRKDDFKDFRTEILTFLQRIENKLDTKQDK